MTVKVIEVTEAELRQDRDAILSSLRMDEQELRRRVDNEIATASERDALERLKEIAFLLGEDT
ncbi:hypothetical protein ACFWQL_12120 [Amycolatopsis thermoflava]|uniref:hypothetical protein n=1 Tax=Amycolatopsis thermoflava TaxID=84480 RepID=UPI003658D697